MHCIQFYISRQLMNLCSARETLEYMTGSFEQQEDGLFFISTEIKIPSIEVTGIACISYQLASASLYYRKGNFYGILAPL